MKRMPTMRLVIATLVSIGLVLSPVVAANAAAAAALMDNGVAAAGTSTDNPCPCCDMAAKCASAFCTMSCVQLAPADPDFRIALVGHAVLSGIVPPMHNGLSCRPPTPPPRV